MEPIMMFVITAIVAAIFLVSFYKQEQNKIRNHLYINDLQHFYLLTAAEYKIKALEQHEQLNMPGNINTTNTPDISQEVSKLTTAFENNNISIKELNNRLDYLLNTFNINNSVIIQPYKAV
ncbi:hypothetical protein [Mucilaginibacter aquaedulcis]|uniref:hypothetical protein n=1 Tax=Mucilaginibacter aquaedulcis TaxID=1187081 RepID=UPI0025B44C83|nr:hypothetical protein [Mucilaginibacter aquaedulcis]MDN3547235.1 hypothetical protein [Mucilaginibacter aquaedulcis]